MIIFLVGGFLRDKLIGFENIEKDWIITKADFKIMINKRFKLVGKDFPVFLHPINKEEYALARKEKKIKVGYKGFKCYFSKKITLKHDIYRRDITINSIILNKNGYIKDFLKSNIDIKNKTIKNISNAFSEDPLRIFRISRFFNKYYNNGFLISSYTNFLIKKIIKKKENKYLKNERILKELYTATKYKNLYTFFYNLYINNVLLTNLMYVNNLIKKSKIKNIYKNIWIKTCNIYLYIHTLSNNNIIKFSILLLQIILHKKNYIKNIINYYKNNFFLSKKFLKFINNIKDIKKIYKNIYKINSNFLLKINLKKEKIKILNSILICFINNKLNNPITTFYNKYILLEILNYLIKINLKNNLHLIDKKKYYLIIKKTIKKITKNIILM